MARLKEVTICTNLRRAANSVLPARMDDDIAVVVRMRVECARCGHRCTSTMDHWNRSGVERSGAS